jgi:2-oxoglutarate dehydrogenase E2 component (dihydrolipoamide succinyltransferase)
MSIELVVPEVGESISEVQIGEWLKGEGDHVERNEEVVVIETDKATVEISAPQSGKVARILKKAGETAAVNEVIGYLESETADRAQEPPKKQIAKAADISRQEKREPEKIDQTPEPKKADTSEGHNRTQMDLGEETPSTITAAKDQQVKTEAKKTFRTPEIKPVVEQRSEGAELEDKEAMSIGQAVSEPSKNENATRSRFTEAGRSRVKADGGASVERHKAERGDVVKIPQPAVADGREEKLLPMSQLRRRIAERLVQAQQTAALLTTFNEIDMSAVIGLREKYRESFSAKHDAKLGFMSFFVKASIEALKLIPEVNAEIRGENIVYRNYFDIGVAVGGGKGLVVPVLRDAQRLSFAEIEKAIYDFARRADDNKLKPTELQGGTFTISNGGVYGSLLSTPIVNPPQSGILGLHAIQDRPVVRQGTVVIRPMMYVAFTYDHRIVDGREAVTFLKHIRDLIEDPARILLGV